MSDDNEDQQSTDTQENSSEDLSDQPVEQPVDWDAYFTWLFQPEKK